MPNQQASQINTPQLPAQMVASQSGQQMPRTTATPLQALGVGQPPQPQQQQPGMQNALANGFVNRQVGQPQIAFPPLTPLTREGFQKAFYEQWLPKRPPKDQSMLHFEGRDIDLYQLHCEVINSGTVKQVCLPLHSGPFVFLTVLQSKGNPKRPLARHRREDGVGPLPR